MTKFSVIVPTYNERRNIGILYLLLREAFAHPSLAKDEFEVIVVDDNSPDGTADVVRALQKEYRDERLLLRPARASSGSAPPTSTVSLTPRAISSSSWTPT